MKNSKNCIIFRPKYSIWAYISLLVTDLFSSFILINIVKTINLNIGITKIILIIGSLIIGFFIFYLLFILLIYHTMRYEFHDEALYLIIGPWKDKIYYNEIVDIENKNLLFNPIASFRFPGIAIFNVYYSDEGIVRMFSTHSLLDIILIKTNRKKYGVSPRDKEEFIKLLFQKMNKGALKNE